MPFFLHRIPSRLRLDVYKRQALVGIAKGLDIPVGLAGGAIISGAYFGDKMSPLSDTTNLSAAIAGAKLTDHIKHMMYTTAVSYTHLDVYKRQDQLKGSDHLFFCRLVCSA